MCLDLRGERERETERQRKTERTETGGGSVGGRYPYHLIHVYWLN